MEPFAEYRTTALEGTGGTSSQQLTSVPASFQTRLDRIGDLLAGRANTPHLNMVKKLCYTAYSATLRVRSTLRVSTHPALRGRVFFGLLLLRLVPDPISGPTP